ncbi:uncharacterized protein LOC136083435 [Hydra vulgaris]|uniref:Uncharacterized protein LOC136083435 n=1 Tax=Hydra vulgaris TaxID=6087 RepID=A0ABM4CB69_HYDVU
MDKPMVIPKVKLKLLKNRSSNVRKIVKTKINTHPKNKSAAKRKTTKKKCQRQIFFEKSTSEKNIDEKLCDDDELDYGNDLFSKDTEMCLVCGEYGKKTKLWYRCVYCGKWAHADCSGYDSPKNYICDFCPTH